MMKGEVQLNSIDPTNLDIATDLPDLRRDLHVFMDYVQEREVKRAVRTNWLSKTDARRLAKLMSDPQAADEIEAEGHAYWVDFVDDVALSLGFVNYDTKGVYAGYTSREPSFPDNYIEVEAEAYERFLAQSLAEQEKTLLRTLVDAYSYSNNEFYRHGIVGRLTPFSQWGSAVGIMPSLNFAKIRRFLLELLAGLESGTWYSTASLVAYLKANHPYFLIPKQPQIKDRRWDGRRYYNFHESKNHWGNEINISDDAPDAFARVEGRYVERFLEGIPLLLGYVEVAYRPDTYQGVYPPRGVLRTFRTTDRLARALRGEIDVQVTVQPNFEIHVESEVYPAGVLARLAPLSELISQDTVTILKLEKQKVAERLAEDGDLDPVALLAELSGRPLPQNVAVELQEWTGHAENFVLYEGFGLYEGEGKAPDLEQYTVERISPTLRIVRNPMSLFTHLEASEQIPLRVRHTLRGLQSLPEGVTSLFPIQSRVADLPRTPQPLTLLRRTRITLHFPDPESWKMVRQRMLDARCPIEADQVQRTLTYTESYAGQVEAIFQELAQMYKITVEDIVA